MEFNQLIDTHRSQIRFYRFICGAVLMFLGILAVVVPFTQNTGPYVIEESPSLATLNQSEPWKLTIARVEGFLTLFLNSRYDWTKENFDRKENNLKAIVSSPLFSKLKDSLLSYSVLAKSQDTRCFFVLEGFRFSNSQHLIEAQVSRVLRVGNTGAVTPLQLRMTFEDAPITESNPYGLRIRSLEEREAASSETTTGDSQ